MIDHLEPAQYDAVMKILSAVYETGLVEEVNLSVVYGLLGVDHDPKQADTVDFNDEEWIKAYIRFIHGLSPDATVISFDAEDENLAESLHEHLADLGIDADDMEEIENGVLQMISEHQESQDEETFDDSGPRPTDKIH